MSFKKLDIKKNYINQGENNLVDSFLNPTLKEAKLYRRSVGFFSSSVFELLMPSLPYFVRNNGKIMLVVSPELSSDDINMIDLGYKKKFELLHDKALIDFESGLDEFNDEDLKTLYDLISKGILDIKIACVKNDSGIYHDKLGILTDKENNHIVFYGSPNSSKNAYQRNYEKIRTAVSWNSFDVETIDDEINEFDNLWNNTNEFVSVYTFNESLKKSILKVCEYKEKARSKKEPINLFDYQELAISKWKENDYNGFYVMATGTGKTWTAIYSALELDKTVDNLTVIIAPYKHLVKQWYEDIIKVYSEANIVMVSSENPDWFTECNRAIIAQKYRNKKAIIISTIKSFYSDRFKQVLNSSKYNKLLIVDEAHRFTQRDEDIKNIFKYKLGLSATPINGKNNLEGERLLHYFGGQVFSLPIEEALEKGFLVKYNYHPIFVDATPDEEQSISTISRQIAACFVNGILVDKDRLLRLTKNRLRIIAMAQEKNTRLREIVSSTKVKDHFIIYCGDGKLYDGDDEIRHIQFVKQTIDEMGISSSQFTAEEDISRRMELVDMFNNNDINSLVAIRCLDEGINIPSIKSALILASNDDYREFVQRRGRILRKYKDKSIADIYDVIVLPKYEYKIAEIEFRRFYEYSRLAANYSELRPILEQYLSKYNLTYDNISFDLDLDEEDDLDE